MEEIKNENPKVKEEDEERWKEQVESTDDKSNNNCDKGKGDNSDELGPDINEYSKNIHEEFQEYSLTDLPIEVIVHIFDYLSLPQRYQASLTCRYFYEAFCHPKLWREQTLMLIGDTTNYRYKQNNTFMDSNVPEQSTQMIARFGKYFQHLTISVSGFLGNLEEWSPVLLLLSQECRLEKLTLQIGKVITMADQYGRPPSPPNLKVMLSFIENAFRMKHLDLKSWPFFHETMQSGNLNIFKALINNPKLKELEKLDMFLPYRSQMWTERNAILPDPTVMINLVQHFEYLQVLGLRSPMLSNDLLLELGSGSRPGKIKKLRIFVTYSTARKEYRVPYIKATTWKKLVESSPAFTVECKVMSRVPNHELSNMLTIDCPLSKIEFLEFARIDEEQIFSLASKYRNTLSSFIVYCELNDCDAGLLKLAEECRLLTHLVVHNANRTLGVNHKTVAKLASMKGHEWKVFMFYFLNVSFEDKPEGMDDPDTVVAQNDHGEYYLVSLVKFHTSNQFNMEDHIQRCNELKEKIKSYFNPRYVHCTIIDPTNVSSAFRLLHDLDWN